jgi:class 3 adenylate cyclase
MNQDTAARLGLHAVEILYSLALLAWFFLPLHLKLPGLYSPLQVCTELAGSSAGGALRTALAVLILLIPALRLYKIACPFLDRVRPGLTDPRRALPILVSLLSSSLALATVLSHALVHAGSRSYFAASSPVLYAVFLASLAYNAFFLVLFITQRNLSNESYREYPEFRRESGRGELRQGIQRRLLISFLALILVIVSVLSFVLMRNFSRTIMRSVIDSGRALAEREKPTTVSKELAFLFTDIRGFTSLCEGLAPDKVVSLLNHYLDLQSSVILANGGDIDKFVGDAIMAFFDGARKELAACKAAMEIRQAMAEHKELSAKAGRKALAIGIDIHAGPVVFGSVGTGERMAFTSSGDTVNPAARLEGANKSYGTKSLITESVQSKVAHQFLCRELDTLTVKGKSRPVRIFEVLQDKLWEICKVFEQGLTLYRRQRWGEAVKAFSYLKSRYHDQPSAVFLRRIELFRRSPPPEDWDGVFSLTVK